MKTMKPLPNKINEVFVLCDLGMNKQIPAKRIAMFVCKCGNNFVARVNSVKTGDKKSCGCIKNNDKKTHCLTKHPLYRKWSGMVTRTTNKKEKCYKNYGGRGIKVCNEWRNNFMSFYNWSINNGYKKGLTIDRINNNGNYEPNNCQWISMMENSMKDRYSEFIKNNKSDEICYLYLNNHVTITHIAKVFKTYKEVISRILKDKNIKIEQRRMKKCY